MRAPIAVGSLPCLATRSISQSSPAPRSVLHPAIRLSRRTAYASQSTLSSISQSASRVPRRRAVATVSAAATAAVIGTLTLTEDGKTLCGAFARSFRVASTVALCMNDYRRTLKKNESVPDAEEAGQLLKDCHQRSANRALATLEKNGSIFIKLGQHLSAMNYLLPLEWTTTFIPLQDKCPVSSIESIREMFLGETGQTISQYFSDFASLPIGAASLAQVHLATIRENGQKVAVKVQHPSLKKWSTLDLWLTRTTFRTLKYWFPAYDLEWLSTEMEFSLPKELDFRLEGENAIRCKEYFSNIPDIPLVVPNVVQSFQRVLVMENVSGHRSDDLDYLDHEGIDRDEVSATFARIFNTMIFGKDAPLHCDPHGGNLAIRKNNTRGRAGPNFDVILYDHGLYRDIPEDLRRSYAKLWLAVIDANEPRMRQYAKEVAGVTDEQFPLFASAITGRDFRVLTDSITAPRTDREKDEISSALGDGMLQQLVEMLGQVPRIILLILKTNDLTRSLDENLHTRQGPVRSFLILAKYCARTVYEEQMEMIRGSLLRPSNFVHFLGAWFEYHRIDFKLRVFEAWLTTKRMLNMV